MATYVSTHMSGPFKTREFSDEKDEVDITAEDVDYHCNSQHRNVPI